MNIRRARNAKTWSNDSCDWFQTWCGKPKALIMVWQKTIVMPFRMFVIIPRAGKIKTWLHRQLIIVHEERCIAGNLRWSVLVGLNRCGATKTMRQWNWHDICTEVIMMLSADETGVCGEIRALTSSLPPASDLNMYHRHHCGKWTKFYKRSDVS